VTPAFDLQGGVPLCAARAVLVCALLSAFGALAFGAVVAPKARARMAPEMAAQDRARLLVLVRASVVIGLLAAGAWLLLQAWSMADAGSLAEAAWAVPKVLAGTAFGHVLAGQVASLAALLALAWVEGGAWRRRAAFAVATLALVLQAGHSHAYSMYDGASVLLGCDILHLLGAGAWLGGLVPLLLLVRAASPKAGATAARWFSPLGQWAVAALVVSAAFQGWVLVATIPGLVGTAYGWMVLVKLALSAVLLGFAAANRYRFAPALLRERPDAARRALVRSVTLQTGFALAIVAAASVLSGLPPSMHEQPTWPFAERFSLAAVDEDPDFRREVILAGLALGGAAVVLTIAFVARRLRLAAGGVAAVIAWFAIPHLDLLLVTAYPTSFYHSPTGFTSASIVAGQAVYGQHCAVCHGTEGHGDGPAARTLPVPPADLTAEHLWMHSDGELFWWLAHGMRTPEGKQAMPGFAGVLDDDQRWAAIDFIRARNAGDRLRDTGSWSPPLRAPAFGADCGDSTIRSSDLHGHFVLLRFGATSTPGPHGVVTVAAGAGAAAASGNACVNRDETVPLAYAVASGVDMASLPGTEFLIDDRGWLRAMQRPGAAPTWNDAPTLEAEIRSLRSHPVTDSSPAPMRMPMDMPM
jgi:putative copper export protein/mono/diheme cytochrome c family protein